MDGQAMAAAVASEQTKTEQIASQTADVLRVIASRTTAPILVEPAPSEEELRRILGTCLDAPDHGRLTPWLLAVIAGPARDRLGKAMAACYLRQRPQASAEELEREQAKARRAPTIIAVGARPTPEHKVPVVEQLMSVAAGVQNMVLAAHAMGYGTAWKTGAAAYDDEVKRLLGFTESDQIVAFLYVGTPSSAKQVSRKSTIEQHLKYL